MKWWEISSFPHEMMRNLMILLGFYGAIFPWEISDNIIILRFCNVVEGQATYPLENTFLWANYFHKGFVSSFNFLRCSILM